MTDFYLLAARGWKKPESEAGLTQALTKMVNGASLMHEPQNTEPADYYFGLLHMDWADKNPISKGKAEITGERFEENDKIYKNLRSEFVGSIDRYKFKGIVSVGSGPTITVSHGLIKSSGMKTVLCNNHEIAKGIDMSSYLIKDKLIVVNSQNGNQQYSIFDLRPMLGPDPALEPIKLHSVRVFPHIQVQRKNLTLWWVDVNKVMRDSQPYITDICDVSSFIYGIIYTKDYIFIGLLANEPITGADGTQSNTAFAVYHRKSREKLLFYLTPGAFTVRRPVKLTTSRQLLYFNTRQALHFWLMSGKKISS